jgi:peptidoglycan/LPS O-acetylase OafA/YrhL
MPHTVPTRTSIKPGVLTRAALLLALATTVTFAYSQASNIHITDEQRNAALADTRIHQSLHLNHSLAAVSFPTKQERSQLMPLEAVPTGHPLLDRTSRPVPPPRYTELDSLRGIAALTVVFHHFRYMQIGDGRLTGWHKILHLVTSPLTAGRQAVFLFFALSGLVLSLPYLRRKGQDYPTFLIRRVLRIYAPYLFALGLALIGAAIWHGPHGHGSWADLTWSEPISSHLVLQHILFIGNYDWAQYNTVFWSLVMEMRLSIIFPALFAAVLYLRNTGALIAALALVFAAPPLIHRFPSWELTLATLPIISIFIAGILLAKNVDTVNAWLRKIGTGGRLALAAACLFLYLESQHVYHFVSTAFDLETPLVTIAAAGFIALAINSPLICGLLNSHVPRFLGRISYSLYLVHGTVLFALTFAPTGKLPAAILFPLYLATSLLFATFFCFAVEESFLQLSRRVSQWSNHRLIHA